MNGQRQDPAAGNISASGSASRPCIAIDLKFSYASPDDIHVYSIDEVFIAATGCPAAAGIGANLYLAKIAMDIVAKHIPSDTDADQPALFTACEALEKQKAPEQRRNWTHRRQKN